MREEQTFAQDCAELLRDELAAGRIDRRTFLRGLAALGMALAALAGSGLLAGEAAAQGAKPKEVVLTFDDGPMPWITKSILDTLDNHCTKATFFSVGRMAIARLKMSMAPR